MKDLEVAPHASVIVPTRNGMPLVETCLRALLAQDTPWPYEVIVVDSESTDGTWEFLESLQVERIQIRPEAFNHGGTRNLAASRAKGQFLVFLVQDAVPTGSTWLQWLVKAAEAPGVAGSYGRELPWPSDNRLVQLYHQHAMPQHEERLQQRLVPGQSWQELSPKEKLALATFHDSCSCIRRWVWLEHPFSNLPYGEDIDWGARVIQSGYSIVYEPQSAVYHSHDRSSWYEMKRAYADHELVMRLFGYCAFPRLTGVVAFWLSFSWRSVRAIRKGPEPFSEKAALLLRAPLVTGARNWGSYFGARVAKRASHSTFWRFVDDLMRKGV